MSDSTRNQSILSQAMEVNITLGLLALVVLTLQPYNTEGRNIICRKGLRNLQKRSAQDVVILEGYEVTPPDQERGGDCVEYEADNVFPTPPAETIRGIPLPETPAPTLKIPSKKQLCWMYYGTPVRLYLPMRNLPNSQGNNIPFTGGINGSGKTQARVVCGKLGSFPKNYTDGRGKQNNGLGAVKLAVIRPAMAIQTLNGRNTNFYEILRNYQRLRAAEKPRGRSVSSHCT